MTQKRPRNPYARLTGMVALGLLCQLQGNVVSVHSIERTKRALEQHVKHYLYRAKRVR